MSLRFEYDYNIVVKLDRWASRLPDDVDFIDYWYNFFLSDAKRGIDDKEVDNSASFWITRWRTDFEAEYSPKLGEGFSATERGWFSMYAQYLVYELQTPSDVIAKHYGKPMFEWLMDCYDAYHTIGTNLFLQYFMEKWGMPPGVEKPFRIVNR